MFKMPFYVTASILTSCVAFLFGYTLPPLPNSSTVLTLHRYDTGSIGSVTTMPAFKSTFGDFSATVHGLVVSSSLIPGAITALVAGALAHRFGHTSLISLGSVTYGIGAAVECSAPNLGVFVTGRLTKGIGEGLFLSNVYVQVSEISPYRVRGVMTALPQFLIVSGLVAGYFVCYGTLRLGDGESPATWRLPPAIASFLGLVLSTTYFFTPASPRWLLSKGRTEEARAVVARLGLDDAEQKELLAQSFTVDETTDPNATFWQSTTHTFREFGLTFSGPYRSRTALACFFLGIQQFSGIDGVLYYAPILFTQAGLDSERASFLASGVSALVILGATIPATLFADRWGRRTSGILGGVLITSMMVVMGSLYAAGRVHADRGAGRWLVIVCIYLFAISFSFTWAIGFRTWVVESMPRKTRSSASSLAQCSNWVSQ